MELVGPAARAVKVVPAEMGVMVLAVFLVAQAVLVVSAVGALAGDMAVEGVLQRVAAVQG
ncbi:hypothetical protein A5715_17105 [Mycolicibacter heraklionensis]|nr:hypothetical protein A5715_17105 [Mycolicibacter heraklionensis]